MSVCNVIFERHRIRLVSDTIGYRNKQPVCFGRKAHLIMDGKAVLMVRGYRALALQLEEFAEEWTSYVDAVGCLEQDLNEMPQRFVNDSGAEITLAGTTDNGLAVTRFAVIRISGDIKIRRLDLGPGVYLSPSLGSHHIPVDMSDEQIFKVALLQQDLALRHNLNMCIGGDVELTSIIPGGRASVRKLGEYRNKAFAERQISRARPADLEKAAA